MPDATSSQYSQYGSHDITRLLTPDDADDRAWVETSPRNEEPLPEDTDLDLLREFVAESRTALAGLDAAITRMTDGYTSHDHRAYDDVINHGLRTIHTIKGTSAALGLVHLSHFAHHVESFLNMMCAGAVSYPYTRIALTLRAFHMFEMLLDVVEHVDDATSLQAPRGYTELLAALVTNDVTALEATNPQNGGSAPSPSVRESARESAPRSARGRQRHAKLEQTRDVQTKRIRTAPLTTVFQKMERVCRDAARRTGKDVVLVQDGAATEVGATTLRIVGDALVHLVRNAVAHGIERSGYRIAVGKPVTGHVTLTASSTDEHIIIELHDDGYGLDRTRIARQALALGVIDTVAGMNDAAIDTLIFIPGLSTNDVVTDLAGRGVGMDVVRRNVERLNGTIDIASVAGQGTTFTLRLPRIIPDDTSTPRAGRRPHSQTSARGAVAA